MALLMAVWLEFEGPPLFYFFNLLPGYVGLKERGLQTKKLHGLKSYDKKRVIIVNSFTYVF